MQQRSTSMRLGALLTGLLFCGALVSCGDSQPPKPDAKTEQANAEAAAKAAAEKAKVEEAVKLGMEAVVYGLPLILMETTRQKFTNVPQSAAFAAPTNQFAHDKQFPTAAFKDVVRANVDTLYSSAFLDLSKEPIVLSVPDTKGRYYLMPLLDAYTNVFASPGKRTTGTKAGNFAITGPGWSGDLPKGVTEIKAPTSMVWVVGRTQTNGPSDYKAVHAIQAQYKLTPLSAFGKPYSAPEGAVDPNIDMKLPPVERVQKMDAATFFGMMAALMKDNPPPEADAPMLPKLAKIGVVPGQPFDIAKLDPAVAKGLEGIVAKTIAKIDEEGRKSAKDVDGWSVFPGNMGQYGTAYGDRAYVALVGLGANLNADAIYPSAFVDSEGQKLNGANRYVIRYEKGQTPPAEAFWSLTMYDQNFFFVDNAINRYAVSSWMKFKYNKDGSLDIYVQKDAPGKDKESNWLPAPEGDFSITNRLYWPKPAALDGTWKPPVVEKLK